MEEQIFYDLETMVKRAIYYRRQWTVPVTHHAVEHGEEIDEFITECRNFQRDILRPWNRENLEFKTYFE